MGRLEGGRGGGGGGGGGPHIWPCGKKVKGQSTTIIWINLVDIEFQILYTKIQPQSFLGSGEDF